MPTIDSSTAPLPWHCVNDRDAVVPLGYRRRFEPSYVALPVNRLEKG